MASAAAVGVDAARSPLHNDEIDDAPVTSAIGSREHGFPGTDMGEEMDDAIKGTNRRKAYGVDAGDRKNLVEDDSEEDGANGGLEDDLFGDDEEEAPEP
jgi:hypothetical protein